MPDELDWSSFDKLRDGRHVIPVFGFQVLTFLAEDGQPQTDFAWVGEQVTAGAALGAIMGSAFEFLHDHLHEQMEDGE
jgi:hypothetical protein